MLSVLEERREALPLEVSGLGYVNLLHIAVVLAAIPDRGALDRQAEESGALSTTKELWRGALRTTETGRTHSCPTRNCWSSGMRRPKRRTTHFSRPTRFMRPW
jgi:hypothetical protein